MAHELKVFKASNGTGRSTRPLTRDEEADEIIKKLRTPPPPLIRRIEAKWTVESMKDLSTSCGLDLEKEIIDALSASMIAEIDKEIMESYGKRRT
jgi:hypothetical protein